MSMHKKPLTRLEEAGLRLHGLDVGKPSQLSDVFRHGVAWALSQQTPPEAVAEPAPRNLAQESCTRVAEQDAIRDVFVAHGFTIKEGEIDLKEYVYRAAHALIAKFTPHTQSPYAPVYQFQWREIGESGWEDCDLDWYAHCQSSPENDTRVVAVSRWGDDGDDSKVLVTAEPLIAVLKALVGSPYLIRELQATREPSVLFPDNPINALLREVEALVLL